MVSVVSGRNNPGSRNASTPSSDNKCFFVGSGGTVNLEYSLVNRITYSMTNLSVSDLTEDRTITFEIAEK